jgi:hypothetical protein
MVSTCSCVRVQSLITSEPITHFRETWHNHHTTWGKHKTYTTLMLLFNVKQHSGWVKHIYRTALNVKNWKTGVS